VRKGVEAYFTLLIEACWPKERILEVYLNVAELGNGVFGVEAAARRFFRSSAAELTPEQAALLAAVLPSPRRYSVEQPGDYVRGRQSWVLGQMRSLHADGHFRSLAW
jgi:monofunctional glycosyltransferase